MEHDIRGGHLYFDGCDTTELAARYGTPLYLISQTGIEQRCAELREHFLNRYENTRAAYACKALCTKAVCRIMQRQGLELDVVSGGELYTALQAGFPAGGIEFNGNNKQRWEIELAVEHRIGRIIIDGMQELDLLEAICREKGQTMEVLYRITPGVGSDTHAYISTGVRDSKFGIPLDEDIIYPAIKRAINSPYVRFLGVHFHVGSQLLDNRSHLSAVEVSLELMKGTLERYGHTMTELNFGGGFATEYTKAEEHLPFAYYLDPMMERTEAFCKALGVPRPTIVVEPGRSLVAEAGLTLYTVGNEKHIPGVRKYLSVDGGMTDNIRPGLYQAEYTALLANRADAPPEETLTIAGKCCEATDILIRDLALPAPKSGDILAVFGTGAYCFALANNYNRTPLPATVLVNNGAHALMMKRQSLEQLLENEVMPDTLE